MSHIHKCLYELLLEQVGILTTLKFPRCTALFLQQLEQWGVQTRKQATAFLQEQQQKPLNTSNNTKNINVKFQAEDFGVLRTELLKLQQLVGAVLSIRAKYLLAQGRVSAATLLLVTQAQHPSYSSQATDSAATAAYDTLHSKTNMMSGVKRDISSNTDDDSNIVYDDATSPGGMRRKTKRRRSVSSSSQDNHNSSNGTENRNQDQASDGDNSAMHVDESGAVSAKAMMLSYDGAQRNSYNMPAQMTLSDVAREQIMMQQQQQQGFMR